jgi:hypothetical protein
MNLVVVSEPENRQRREPAVTFSELHPQDNTFQICLGEW